MKSEKSGIKHNKARFTGAFAVLFCILTILTSHLHAFAQEVPTDAAEEVSAQISLESSVDAAAESPDEIAVDAAAEFPDKIAADAAADSSVEIAEDAAATDIIAENAQETDPALSASGTEETDGSFLSASNAAGAWQYSRGDGVIVAVIDTGINAGHEDLEGSVAGALTVIPKEEYETGLFSKDSVASYGPMDDVGHGTHVAGIIAGNDNSVGVTGIAPDSKILSVKILDAYHGTTSGKIEWLTDAIQLAVDNGAKVINCSIIIWRSYYSRTNTYSCSEDNSSWNQYPLQSNALICSGSSTSFTAMKRTISPLAIFA